MELFDSPFGDTVGKYFWENDQWPEGCADIAEHWRPAVEHIVDGFDVDDLVLQLMHNYKDGYVQDQIDKMAEEKRAAMNEFLDAGTEALISIVAVSLKCAAHDFEKALKSFVTELGAEQYSKTPVN